MMSTLPGLGVSEKTGCLPFNSPAVAGKISR